MTGDANSSARANAEVLFWQARLRIMVAVVAGGAAFLLQQAGLLAGNAGWLLGAIAGYIAIVGALGWAIHRAGVAGHWMVGATVFCDLLFVFSSTLASSPPADYDRILILSFFVLPLTESYFGRRHAALALAAVVVGYVAVVAAAIHGGARLRWSEELWSVALFTIAAVTFVVQHGSFHRRLGYLVELFESAEAGEFGKAYDLAADKRPDAITRVGRAYNRVRFQLASMVLTDPLTGCLNRRGLDQALARELARSARAGSDLSLLALDVDHFKEINDRYGHLAGDAMLREFGALLVQTARAGDMVARTGGEEFNVLLPDTDPAGAYRAAIRVCDAMRTHRYTINEKRIHLTISVGVASASSAASGANGAKGANDGGDAGDGSGAVSLKERADAALYAAKRGGRDRVRVWNEDDLRDAAPA